MRSLVSGILLGVVMAGAPALGAAHAQFQTTQPTGRTTMPPIDGRDPPDANDPAAAMRHAQLARLMLNERQKKIADDTAKLLTLATELKADVDKTTKDEMSLEVIRKADEIERLAHDVKTRMKG